MFLLAFALLLVAPAALRADPTPARPAPKFLSAAPDQAEGGRVLEGFRNVGVQGDYWLQFDLRVMPRQGPERELRGQMFGAPGTRGPLTRLIVTEPATHLILHGGNDARAWRWEPAATGPAAMSVPEQDWLAPIVDTDLTLFDLQMPFLRWTDFVYEGVANVRGRPAHAFLLYPPQPLAGPPDRPVPAAVRVFLDTQFSALTQAEWLDAQGKPLKSVTVLDLKKVRDQWIVKSIDLRNHTTRAKTRFALTAAALDLQLPGALFQPEQAAESLPTVPAAQIERL